MESQRGWSVTNTLGLKDSLWELSSAFLYSTSSRMSFVNIDYWLCGFTWMTFAYIIIFWLECWQMTTSCVFSSFSKTTDRENPLASRSKRLCCCVVKVVSSASPFYTQSACTNVTWLEDVCTLFCHAAVKKSRQQWQNWKQRKCNRQVGI